MGPNFLHRLSADNRVNKILIRMATVIVMIRLLLNYRPDLGLHCLSGPFCKVTSSLNFKP